MANVLNRTTNQWIESVDTPDYDPAEWVINPDTTPVEGINPLFWFINEDDTLRPMTIEEQDFLYLQRAKDRRRIRINEFRDERIRQGFWYGGYLFDTDDIARSNAASTVAAVAAGMPIPAGFTWRDAENNDVPMTGTQVIQFGISMLAYVNGLYKYSWNQKAYLQSMTSIDEIRNWDFTTGWPSRNFDGSAPEGRE